LAKKSAKKSQTIPFVTPWFTTRFPKISTPDTKGKYADGKFKTDGELDDAQYEAVEKTLKEAAEKLWPDVPVDEVTLPLKNLYENKEAKEKGEVEARGFTLKSQYRPTVFDSKKKKLPEGVNIGGGSVIRVASAIFPWSKTSKMKVVEKGKSTMQEITEYGLGLRLGDVQVKELVEFSGGGDGSAFDEVEDGFEYDGEGDDQARADQFGDASDL
jgi:DNA-directed RNA polymerase